MALTSLDESALHSGVRTANQVSEVLRVLTPGVGTCKAAVLCEVLCESNKHRSQRTEWSL